MTNGGEKQIKGMQEGAFALLDCLGFKGVWRRVTDADQIVSKFQEIASRQDTVLAGFLSGHRSDDKQKLQVAFLSDSVAIGLRFEEGQENPHLRGFVVAYIVSIVNELIRRFALDPIPLALRGCVTYGQFRMEGNLIVGPAVDEAAEFHSAPQGAFVWLAPAAERVKREFDLWLKSPPGIGFRKEFGAGALDTMIELILVPTCVSMGVDPRVFRNMDLATRELWIGAVIGPGLFDTTCRYDMPVKGGDRITVSVADPIGTCVQGSVQAATMNGIAKSMSGNTLDVLAKARNTKQYFEFIRPRGIALDKALTELIVKTLERVNNQPSHT